MNMPCPMESTKTPIKIGIATILKEKREIYRLRYRIYVEEMNKKFESVDHRNKSLYDELDQWGVLLYAQAGSELIGTMRVNIGPLAKFPCDLVQHLSLTRFQKFAQETSNQSFAYTSRLMVDPHYRNSVAMYLLMAKGYELYCHYHVSFNFGVCKFHLLPLYEQFGYKRFNGNYMAPRYDGVQSSIVVLVDDIEHLRAVRSPYYRLARKRKIINNRAAEWFSTEFAEYSRVVNNQLLSEIELWDILHSRLGQSPHLAVPVLQGLSESESRKLVHSCGIILPCRVGEAILARDCVSHTLNILLSGRLQSSRLAVVGPATVLPGQCFGATGLVGQPMDTEDVYAATDAEILVLSGLNFQRFAHSHPDIAGKVLQNAATLTGALLPTTSSNQ